MALGPIHHGGKFLYQNGAFVGILKCAPIELMGRFASVTTAIKVSLPIIETQHGLMVAQHEIYIYYI